MKSLQLLEDAQSELKLAADFLSTVKSKRLQPSVRTTLLQRLPVIRRRIRRAIRDLEKANSSGIVNDLGTTMVQSSGDVVQFRFKPFPVDWAAVRRDWFKRAFSYSRIARAAGTSRTSVIRAVKGHESRGSAYARICEFFATNGYALPEKQIHKSH